MKVTYERLRELQHTDAEFNKERLPRKKNIEAITERIQYLTQHPINKSMVFEDRIAYFNSYAKSRMDFLADIATGIPTMESSKLFYAEVLAGIDRNRILLDNISGVEKFNFKFELNDCRGCSMTNGLCSRYDCRKLVDIDNDILVAVPNDILGQHAFYIILENLIRNTAKHTAAEVGQLITFHIEVREPSKDLVQECPRLSSYYEIQVYDNVDFKYKPAELSSDDKSFFKNNHILFLGGKKIDDIEDIDHLEKIVYRQNVYINQDLLDKKTNTLRKGAWGMIEMEAAAAYLRKIPIDSIDENQFALNVNDLYAEEYGISRGDYRTANILKAFIKKTDKKTRHLAYRFFMPKPKEMLFVTDGAKLNAWLADKPNYAITSIASNLLNTGVWLKTKGQAVKGVDEFQENKVYEHELLVKDEDIFFKEASGTLPDRVITFNLLDLLELSQTMEGADRAKKEVWTAYTEKLPNISILPFRHRNRMHEFGDTVSPVIEASFNHHGTDWPSLFKDVAYNAEANISGYIEIVTGTNNLSDLLIKVSEYLGGHSKTHLSYPAALYAKLKCAIADQIVILDERAQEASVTLTYKPQKVNGVQAEIKYNELFLASGIYIPNPNDFNLSRISYKEVGKESARIKLISLLKSKNKHILLKRKQRVLFNRVKFLVVHLGVLEKVLNADDERPTDLEMEKKEISKLVIELRDALGGNSIKAIVVSGRGIPPNLPDDIPFVNYSALSQYLIDSRNKILLNELLYSTRKT